MKKKTINSGITLCILLLGSILPVAGGQIDSTMITDTCDTNIDSLAAGPVHKYILIGRIKDLDLNYEFNSTNYTVFTAVRTLEIEIYRYGPYSRFFGVAHYRNAAISFPNEYFQFRGILRDRFICGVFEYNYVY